MSIARKPVIGIVCCSEQLGLHLPVSDTYRNRTRVGDDMLVGDDQSSFGIDDKA